MARDTSPSRLGKDGSSAGEKQESGEEFESQRGMHPVWALEASKSCTASAP